MKKVDLEILLNYIEKLKASLNDALVIDEKLFEENKLNELINILNKNR